MSSAGRPAQRREQVGDVGAVGVAVGIVDQGMAAAVDLLPLAQEQHVAVAAERGVAGPLVTRKYHEPSRFIRLPGEPLQVLPERTRDLEVVALVAGEVQSGKVAGEAEVLLRRARADGLLGLAVQVAPVAAPPKARIDHHGVAAEWYAGPRVLRLEGDRQVARRVDRQTIEADGPLRAADLQRAGQPAHRTARSHTETGRFRGGWVAPAILRLRQHAERRSRRAHSRQQRAPAHRRTGHDRDRGHSRHLLEAIGGDRVDQNPQLEGRLAERLHADTGAAARTVAEAHLDTVALSQEAVQHLDLHGSAPGPDIVLRVVAQRQRYTVRCPRAHVVRRGWIVELRRPHVGGVAPADLDAPGIVDTEVAGAIGEHELLVAARFDLRRQGMAHRAGRARAVMRIRCHNVLAYYSIIGILCHKDHGNHADTQRCPDRSPSSSRRASGSFWPVPECQRGLARGYQACRAAGSRARGASSRVARGRGRRSRRHRRRGLPELRRTRTAA